jgi:glutamate racemase
MAGVSPDRIVIACNTLSIVYAATAFARQPAVPVLGIIDAGVALFTEALAAERGAAVALFGTRSTIESEIHRQRLLARGVDEGRIIAVPCHGLAKAIETNPDSQAVTSFIEEYTADAARLAPPGTPLLLGICCTHFTYVAEAMGAALQRHSGRAVRILDPTDRLVGEVMRAGGGAPGAGPERTVEVRILSKVAMEEGKRLAVGRRIGPISPATADALMAYTRVPELF